MVDNTPLLKEEDGVAPPPYYLPVEVRQGSRKITARGCRLTAGGISCIFDSEHPARSPAEIRLSLPSRRSGGKGRELVCRARPASSREGSDGYEMDYLFTRLDPAVRRRIEGYLKWKDSPRGRAEQSMFSHQARLARNGVTCKSDRKIPLYRMVEVDVDLGGDGRGRRRERPLKLSAVVVGCAREKGGGAFDLTLFFTDLNQRQKRLLMSRVPAPSARAEAPVARASTSLPVP